MAIVEESYLITNYSYKLSDFLQRETMNMDERWYKVSDIVFDAKKLINSNSTRMQKEMNNGISIYIQIRLVASVEFKR